MKTFDEKDLITWTNRHTVKVGDKGYFAHSITQLNNNIKANNVHELADISDDNIYCFKYLNNFDITCIHGVFLPLEAVKEDKTKEKKYRPFKDLYEFYKFLCPNSDFTREDFTQDMLWGLAFTYRKKDTQNFTVTELITKVEYGTVGDWNLTSVNARELDYWFGNYEIMNNNGEWVPFGVIEDD